MGWDLVFNWKKLVLLASAFGGGFAVVMASMVGVWVWYQARPQKQPDWNSTATKSSLQRRGLHYIGAQAETDVFVQFGK